MIRFNLAIFALLSSMSVYEAIAKDVIPDASLYTVKVNSAVKYPFGRDTKGTALGAAFMIDRERGWFLTNAHVARWSPSTILVSFKNHPYVDGQKVYVDNHLDMAVIKVDTKDIPAEAIQANLQCDQYSLPGTAVIAFGHPWSLDYTATRGIISGSKFMDGIENLQTDAALNPGNSGGPLIDEKSGNILGINAAGLSKSTTEGMNFAVPIKLACTIVDLLKQGKNPAPPALPITLATTLNDKELVVGEVKDEWSKYFRVGDRILSVDGDKDALYPSRLLDRMRGKDQVSIVIKRNGQEQDIKVDVPKIKNEAKRLGVQVSGMTLGVSTLTDVSQKEIWVQYLEDASIAQQSLLREGDIILSIDGVSTKSHEDVLKALDGKDKMQVEVVIKRSRQAIGSTRYDFLVRKLRVENVFVVNENGIQK
jgi:serine protease Do